MRAGATGAFFACCFLVATSRRASQHDEGGALGAPAVSLAEALSNASVSLGAGSMVRDRFLLKELVSRQQFLPKVGRDFPAYRPGSDIAGPNAVINRFSQQATSFEPQHLGAGSFKDCWKALDKSSGEEVIVALFYHGQGASGIYLTKQTASALNIRGEVEQAQQECLAVIEILSDPLAKLDPSGASRICACKSEHISDAGPADPLFIVMEDCGTTLDKYFINSQKYASIDGAWVRKVMSGVLEGVDFLSKLGRIHHDIKMGNIAQKDGEAKLIDFGALAAFPEDTQAAIAYTPGYVPYEVFQTGLNFDVTAPAYAFDTFSTGGTWWALLCRSEPPDNPYAWRPDRHCPIRALTGAKESDFQLIQGLTKMSPRVRLSPAEALSIIDGALTTTTTTTPEPLPVRLPVRYVPSVQVPECDSLLIERTLVTPRYIFSHPYYVVTVRPTNPRGCSPVPSFRVTDECFMSCTTGHRSSVFVTYSTSYKTWNKFVFSVPAGKGIADCTFETGAFKNVFPVNFY